MSRDQWIDIQQKIDGEYERKLKLVGDEAMNKLKAFQAEHKDLLEKTQYLIDTAEDPQIMQKPSRVETIRAFHKEFNDVLSFGTNAAGELYLVDMLKQLHLLPSGEELPNKDYERELYGLLTNSKDNLLIRSELEQVDTYSNQDFTGDLTRNLFKICCAILDLQINQRTHNYLDAKLLQSYLMHVNYTTNDCYPEITMAQNAYCTMVQNEVVLIPVPLHLREVGSQAGYFYEESEMVSVSGFTLRDQLASIKSLINRPQYSLSDKQITNIAEAFQNFADNRKSWIERRPMFEEEQLVPTTKVPVVTSQQVSYVDPRYSARGPQRNTVVQPEPEKVYYKASPNSRTIRMSNTAAKPTTVYQAPMTQPQKWQYTPLPTRQPVRPISAEIFKEPEAQMSFGANSRTMKSPRNTMQNVRRTSPNTLVQKPQTRFTPVPTRNVTKPQRATMNGSGQKRAARPDTGTRFSPTNRYTSPRQQQPNRSMP